MIGFRTIHKNKQSKDYYFVSNEADQGNYLNIKEGRIFQVIEPKDYIKIGEEFDKGYQCKEAKVIEEYVIRKEGVPEIFSELNGGVLYWAGVKWCGVTVEMRRKAWKKLKDKWLYYAMEDWEGITMKMCYEEGLKKLNNQWLFRAGCDWLHIPKKIRKEAWKRLNGQWLFYAGCDWQNITKKMKKEALKRLEGDWLYWAIKDWKI